MARAHEPDISTRKPPPGQVGPSDFVIHGYGFNETHLLISGPSGSKREKGMFSKLRVFFQEALAQNKWISNLRNLFFFLQVHIYAHTPRPKLLIHSLGLRGKS